MARWALTHLHRVTSAPIHGKDMKEQIGPWKISAGKTDRRIIRTDVWNVCLVFYRASCPFQLFPCVNILEKRNTSGRASFITIFLFAVILLLAFLQLLRMHHLSPAGPCSCFAGVRNKSKLILFSFSSCFRFCSLFFFFFSFFICALASL